VADAAVWGGLARYINHSCNPNCIPKVFFVEGVARMGIYAKRDLKLGEELCYDYKVRGTSHCGL
jgi:histone-lysine N-methyltransferase SETD1